MSYVSPFTGDVIQPTDVSFRQFTIASNTTLAWPINGNFTGNYAARIMEVDASSGGLWLRMPPADQTSVGTDSLILNIGSNTFSVQDNSGGSIVSIAAGEAKYIYVTTNPDAAGTWGVIDFGAGTSGGTASSLAGYGLVASGNTLNQSHPSSSIVNGATFSSTDRAQLRIWNSGSGTLNLPLAASLGDNWFVLLKNNGTGTITVSTTSGELIDGQITKQFAPNNSAFIVCNGTSFVTVGFGRSAEFFFTVLVKSVTNGTYNLTAQEASNIVQEFVGNLSGNVTIQYPPVVQFYIISNQTVDNGYTLEITTGAVGASTVFVPASNQVSLFCDGTNFFNANTVQVGASAFQLVDGSVGSPSLSFITQANLGLYKAGTNQIGVAVNGVNLASFTASGIDVNGTGTFSSGIAGGSF